MVLERKLVGPLLHALRTYFVFISLDTTFALVGMVHLLPGRGHHLSGAQDSEHETSPLLGQ